MASLEAGQTRPVMRMVCRGGIPGRRLSGTLQIARRSDAFFHARAIFEAAS